MNHPEPWTDLIARWDAQQGVYIPQRDAMYEAMFEALAHLRPAEELVVLDLACGPGAISRRLLDRFPAARAVAVDVDPVLLRLGRGAYGDADGRLRWAGVDLRDPDWPQRLGPDGAAGTFDAVLSSTALHWLDPATLAATYRRCHELLRPDGVLLNADYLPHPAAGRLRDLSAAMADERQDRAVATGAESWDAWWEAVAAEPALAEALDERSALWPEGSRDWTGPTLAFHETALLEAGFAEAGTLWQDLNERILVALK
ncbi:class I SAM-dependent methyltransferase [Nocardioides insulae]|uniref:class I SAM-dependent methyltransferase n=1 Tax=Nocardioides insulae TaxID=394734 RepID=UPI00040D986A|nr:class I SAM-dependent methyltransferase [Nocardioides insulae]